LKTTRANGPGIQYQLSAHETKNTRISDTMGFCPYRVAIDYSLALAGTQSSGYAPGRKSFSLMDQKGKRFSGAKKEKRS
jgi:hypothetical protein